MGIWRPDSYRDAGASLSQSEKVNARAIPIAIGTAKCMSARR